MKNMNHRDTSRSTSGKAWLGILVPLALIAIAAGIFLLVQENDQPEETATPEPETLRTGQDYYLMVRTIELYPQRPGGETAWDRIDGSGPDIQFRLSWKDNVVFTSKQQDDTLIGAWDMISLSVKDALLSGNVSLADSIDAAIIRVEKDTNVAIEVWDQDLPGSDAAGSAIMKLDQFKPGDNTFTFDPSDENAIKRIVIRVVDKSLPIRELVDEATKP
ncbi:MAG: hypothetical protein AAF085_03060 [Planctomycetota bacterium]